MIDPAERKLMRQDELDRNAVEGKFGQGKRRYGLGLIRAKLAETSGSKIGMAILVMNLERLLREVFWLLWKRAVFTISCHTVVILRNLRLGITFSGNPIYVLSSHPSLSCLRCRWSKGPFCLNELHEPSHLFVSHHSSLLTVGSNSVDFAEHRIVCTLG